MSNVEQSPQFSPAANIANEFTRLHISPLNSLLLPNLLGSSLSAVATDISFHGLGTFPEKCYGYITLPTLAAQALQKKLNGAFLRGVKMRVEEARPERKRKHRPDGAESEAGSAAKKSKKRDKKYPKLEEGALPAVELSEGRHVKRGWVDGAMGRDKALNRTKGKQSQGKMAFRTHISTAVSEANGKSTEKDEGDDAHQARTKKRVEVKEFDKSTSFPTFLRNTSLKDAKPSTEFVEGTGWVNDSGDVVERVVAKQKPVSNKPQTKVHAPVSTQNDGSDEESDTSSSLSPSSESSVSDDESDGDSTPVLRQTPALLASTEPPTPSAAVAKVTKAGRISPERTTAATPKKLHPLEALFKKPAAPNDSESSTSRSRPAPIKTSFSFGLEDQDDNENTFISESGSLQIPQTPFTRQDLRDRGIRSAAPTPDTAAIGRTFSWHGTRNSNETPESSSDEQDDDDDDDVSVVEEDADDSMTVSGGTPMIAASKDQSDAERRFYERRGEYNRACKARKREARKQARQAENRKVGMGK